MFLSVDCLGYSAYRRQELMGDPQEWLQGYPFSCLSRCFQGSFVLPEQRKCHTRGVSLLEVAQRSGTEANTLAACRGAKETIAAEPDGEGLLVSVITCKTDLFYLSPVFGVFPYLAGTVTKIY